MMLCVSTAFAATITVNNIVNGQTYTAYKLLNYTNSGDAFSYYLTSSEYGTAESKTTLATLLESAGFTFARGTDGNWYVSNTEANTPTAAAITTALKGAITAGTFDGDDAIASQTVQAANDAANFGNLATGYWFVTSTTGSLVSLNSIDANEMVFDKNNPPEIDKSITGVPDGDDHIAADGNSADAKVGDAVNYTVEIIAKKGAQNYVFHDKMSAGLTYDPTTLTIADLTAGEDYTVVYSNATPATAAQAENSDIEAGDNITIRFSKAYLDTINTDTTITITYSAEINDNAVIDSTGNPNTVKLEYGHQPGNENGTQPGPDSREETVTVYTYAIAIKKVNTAGEPLEGVTFSFPFAVETDGNYYKYAGSGTASLQTNSAGEITIYGVNAGTYNITETATLEGYNVLTTSVPVQAQLLSATTTTKTFYIDENGVETQTATDTVVTYQNDDFAATVVMVINKAGVELPSTGGIGTTIFYIAGIVMVLGAAAVIIARRKAEQ